MTGYPPRIDHPHSIAHSYSPDPIVTGYPPFCIMELRIGIAALRVRDMRVKLFNEFAPQTFAPAEKRCVRI
jgi:hypothetical protein